MKKQTRIKQTKKRKSVEVVSKVKKTSKFTEFLRSVIPYGIHIVVGILLIALIGQGIYFQLEIKKLKTSLSAESEKRAKTSEKLDKLQSDTEAFYSDYTETGTVTLQGLSATMTQLENAMAVYDGNVDLYNKQIPALDERLSDVENYNKEQTNVINNHNERLDNIENYLSR